MTTIIPTPASVEIAELCDKAAAIIATNGHHKGYLYDTRQAATGLPRNRCSVDIIGALNTAAHGTPCYAGSPSVFAAEQAILARIDHPSVVAWNDEKGRDRDDVIVLLKQTAAALRTETAA